MRLHEGIQENLRFLIHEVQEQVAACRRHLADPSGEYVLGKDDYIDNLKTIIQRKCFDVARTAGDNESMLSLLKAVDVVTVNLERIADFCENIVDQIGYISDPTYLEKRDFSPFFKEIERGISQVYEALDKNQVRIALEICRTENEIDRLYEESLKTLLADLEHSDNVQSLVTILFIYRYLERMGDGLLNIGEAILSANLGERIKIDEFRALEDSLETADLHEPMGDLTIEALKETKSGNRVNRVRKRGGGKGKLVIFKHGGLAKLKEEKEGVERWQAVMPELVPKVLAFQHQGQSGSLLFEYLPGMNFEELLLQGKQDDVDRALDAVMRTLRDLWTRTRVETPVAPGFLDQLSKRIPEVYAIHPAFRPRRRSIGNIQVATFEDAVARIRPLEERVPAPFSVFIHGDFNIDNVIYREDEDRVYFIDLHRSRMMDYAQDVSVFLVSNFRLRVFDAPIRRLISRTMERFHRFALDFSKEAGDETFSARLALGLVRSYVTSTRFVLDEEFAKSMFMRGQYLAERLLEADPEHLERFQLPREVLVD